MNMPQLKLLSDGSLIEEEWDMKNKIPGRFPKFFVNANVLFRFVPFSRWSWISTSNSWKCRPP
jgi:hypothetical protein